MGYLPVQHQMKNLHQLSAGVLSFIRFSVVCAVVCAHLSCMISPAFLQLAAESETKCITFSTPTSSML